MASSTDPIQVTASTEAAQKPLRDAAALHKFSAHHYAPSPSAVDSNLLILLHGLGDSDTGFFSLGKNLQKTLPQTAVLTLQAPHRVPFLDGPHWMWYASFDQFGELLTKPNPTATVKLLNDVLEHLTQTCGWPASSIHLFGFGQGATLALETLAAYSKTHPNPREALGTLVSVSGELVSHPTLERPSSTPVLHIYRSRSDTPKDSARWASHRKASAALTLHRLALGPDGSDEAMLRANEWDAVMQFWSKFLRNRSSWELEGKVVPLSGQK